jgi:hypothetical protein
MFKNLNTLYGEGGSWVPSKADLARQPSDRTPSYKPTVEDAIAHLARVRRERRASMPSEAPRRRSKLEEASERAGLYPAVPSVTSILASDYAVPYTLSDHKSDAKPAARTSAPTSPMSPLASPRTPPAQPKPKAIAGIAKHYLHEHPSGVSITSPHFHSEEYDNVPHSIPAERTKTDHRFAKRMTWSDPSSARTDVAAEAVRQHLNDLALREECAAALRQAKLKAKKKPSPIHSFIKSVGSKLPKRKPSAKRSLAAAIR